MNSNITPNYKALCAELADSVELLLEMRSNDRPMRVTEDRLNRARAALAQPEPQGPSELELEAIELKLWDKHRTKGYMGEEFMYDNDFSAALDEYRAALARYGTPAIEPVPVSERLPGPEDCDAEGRCWWWDEDDDMWRLSEHRPWLLCWTHWLPHWALPVPAPANTINQNNY
jgi:hypothetical protein